MNLTDDQIKAEAAFAAFMEDPKEKYMVIQGAAGSGKTTLIEYLLAKMRKQYEIMDLLLPGSSQTVRVQTVLTATTNKAAAVLEDILGEEAITIHSYLGLIVRNNLENGKVKLTPGKSYEMKYDSLIIIDEASFISNELFDYIDKSTINCKILLIGDHYQLAPVKQKETIMETLDCTKVYMNKIMRNSGIIMKTGAQFRDTVKTGQFNPIIPDDKDLIHVDGPTFKTLVDEAFLHPDYHHKSAKMLAWTNRRVLDYNRHIRKIKGYPELFQIGENVITNNPIMLSGMRISTDSHITIHDVGEEITQHGVKGRMVGITPHILGFLPTEQSDAWKLYGKLAKAQDWTTLYGLKETWLDLRPVYASTVHKSQGSTYETVFIDLSDIGKCNIASDTARMLYVAISRASKKVVLYGDLPPKYSGV